MDVTTSVPRIARVKMPEKGTFSVRCAETFTASCGTCVVVNLDYGLDLAELCAVTPFDPTSACPTLVFRWAAGACSCDSCANGCAPTCVT